MKALTNLLLNVNVKHIKGAADILISGITYDSREVKAALDSLSKTKNEKRLKQQLT